MGGLYDLCFDIYPSVVFLAQRAIIINLETSDYDLLAHYLFLSLFIVDNKKINFRNPRDKNADNGCYDSYH